MCGIAGFVGAGTRTDLASMCETLVHRGPDDDGAWFSNGDGPPVAFGFRRLAVLDIESGAQPMLSADGNHVVVFNGEIYNHRELRRDLESHGHRFRSDHSDTEVLLHAYARWGDDLVDHLGGMFAFAIYDLSRGRIVLARDRFSKKPLYYAVTDDGFVFASELRALRVHPAVTPEIDRDALVRYFAFGYVPPPRAMWRGVEKLVGGTMAIYDVAARQFETRTFWRFHVQPDDPPPGGPEEWTAQFRDLFGRAVERRLEADVPLGFFLSGGVDSAAVLAMARAHVGDAPLDTFTIGFDDLSYDERRGARETAAHFGTRHHERVLDLDGSQTLLDDLLRNIDEPVADPSLLPTHLLSAFARERVTVAISGDGGDEMFAGYDTFAAAGLAGAYAAVVPPFVHRAARRAAEWLPRSPHNLSFDFKLRRALHGLDHPPALWQPSWLAPADISEISAITGRTQRAEDVYSDVIDLWRGCESDSTGDRMIEFYANYYLPHGVLTKVDRASMLCSLEVRSPFLDRVVAAFCERLPFHAKYRRGRRKWLLRRAVKDLVPPQVLRRPKKGFGIPIASWLREWPMPDAGRAADAGLDPDVLTAKWNEHRENRADHRGVLFAWLCLDRWLQGPR